MELERIWRGVAWNGTERDGTDVGKKLLDVGLLPGRILTFVFFIIMLVLSLADVRPGIAPAFAMDTLTEGELGDITAAAGIVVSSGNTLKMDITVNTLSMSNPSGDGWVIIRSDADGDAGIEFTSPLILSHQIAPGEDVVLDSATTDASTGLTIDDVYIPPDTTFIASASMPVVQPEVTVPNYMWIGVGSTSGTIAKTIGMCGFHSLEVQAFDLQQGYLWTHD